MSKFSCFSDHRFWVGSLAMVNVIIHLAFFDTLGFHRDELLYFSLGQHLSAGYASVPPFTGFIAWIVINTMGYSLFAVRLIPALLSGIYLLLGAGIARELKGGKYAQVLTAAGIMVTPLNLRGFYLFQPVCFDVFFWSLFLYFLLRWINSRENRYLIFTGITAGVALMNKYLIILLIVSVVITFLFSSYRSVFRNRSFYLALFLSLLIFLPNIIWQVIHDFPVLVHMQALNNNQLVHVDRVAFFTDQLFMGTIASILILPGVVFGITGKDRKPYLPLMIASLMVIFLLAILRGKSYYTAGLIPFWVASGAVFWDRIIHKKAVKVILVVFIVLLTIPIFPMGIPVFRPEKLKEYFAGAQKTTGIDMMLRWESGKIHPLPQDYADMLGWDEIAALTFEAYLQVPDQNSLMIFAENYGEAGAIMVLGKQFGLPEPACLSESFYYWFPRNPNREITSMIYINEDDMGDDVKEVFADIRVIGQVTNPLAREYGARVSLCTHPRRSFNQFLQERIPMVKTPFE